MQAAGRRAARSALMRPPCPQVYRDRWRSTWSGRRRACSSARRAQADAVRLVDRRRAREESSRPYPRTIRRYFVLGARSGYSGASSWSFSTGFRPFGRIRQDRPWLSPAVLGYTQNSVWDLSRSPAVSRQPATAVAVWNGKRADDRPGSTPALRAEHEFERQGRDRSRSINTLFRPPEWHWRLRNGDSFQFTPICTIFRHRRNPDIAAYRGYIDWRAALRRGRRVDATGVARIGTSGKAAC